MPKKLLKIRFLSILNKYFTRRSYPTNNSLDHATQGWQAEHNTAGESVLMCDGNQIQALHLGF
jgi:hypothetical protein